MSIANENPNARPIVVLGPTACGKTRLAVGLARAMGGEVVSADSRQVFRGMDIGTGKDLQDYGDTPYHLIDVVDPGTPFSLFDYLSFVQRTLDDLETREKRPIIAGGSGLYLDAILRGYRLVEAPVDPLLRERLKHHDQERLNALLASLRPLHNTTDTQDRERTLRAIEIAYAELNEDSPSVQISIDPVVIGLHCDSDRLRTRIRERLETRLDEGLIDEVESLRAAGLSWRQLDELGLEYRYVALYLQEQLNRNDMMQKLASAIYLFARQQVKWFRRMERQGVAIHWLEADDAPLDAALGLLRR
ncbi:tRNA (adenosine(37)-N6)-dimethylallyltransferase MiaA [Hahella sp. NBU794]|uniref:tRNA (adenosine(37)-N6)-dimethylallyltransferase MiaA n=1 Tax=Hahella sp. NBU794 TaxID=3422590 RepID=UPI003D6F9BB3